MVKYYFQFLLYIVLAFPLMKAGITLLVHSLGSKTQAEQRTIQMMRWLGPIESLSIFTLAWMLWTEHHMVDLMLETQVPYLPQLSIHLDFMSVLFLVVTHIVLFFVYSFSIRYLHKEASYLKFFSLLFLFNFSINILLLTSNISWFLMGWEILGLTSVLLISFYSHREATVKNSLRIFGFYKIADVLLFSGFAFFIHKTGSFNVAGFHRLSVEDRTWVELLIVLAVIVKVGLLPIPWLPRAMEGPTASSAIFYGGLATHVPLLFLIRIFQTVDIYEGVRYSLVAFLSFLLVLSSLSARVQVDAKNSQAYSSLGQFALIIIEILMGWKILATVHVLTHIFYRLSFFLRTPSLIYDYHQLAGFRGQVFAKTGVHFEFLLPKALRNFLYYLTLGEFFAIPRILNFFDKLFFVDLRLRDRALAIVVVGNVMAWASLMAFQSLVMNEIHVSLFLLFIPWVLAILSLYLRLPPGRYLMVMMMCAASLIGILFYAEHMLDLWQALEIELLIYIALALMFLVPIIPSAKKIPRLNPVVFAILLWLVGVPGPGTFIIFENFFHHLFSVDHFVAIGAFIVLSVYVFSVVRFYSLSNCSQISGEKFYV